MWACKRDTVRSFRSSTQHSERPGCHAVRVQAASEVQFLQERVGLSLRALGVLPSVGPGVFVHLVLEILWFERVLAADLSDVLLGF